MDDNTYFWVRGTITPSAFKSERSYEVRVVHKMTTYLLAAGVAYIEYFRDDRGIILNKEVQPDLQEEIYGYVQCRLIRKKQDSLQCLVEFPGGHIRNLTQEILSHIKCDLPSNPEI
jgi:hypothetical protein